MHRVFKLFLLMLIVSVSMSSKIWAAADDLRLAIASTNVSSRMVAIGLGSLAKVRGLGFEIDTVMAMSDDDVLTSLKTGEADFAILGLNRVVTEGLGDDQDIRAMMKYWMAGSPASEAEDESRDSYILLANASVPDHHVDAFIDAILRDQFTLKVAQMDMTRLTSKAALSDLPLLAHSGVESYLRREDIDLAGSTEELPEQAIALEESAAKIVEPDAGRPETGSDDAVVAKLDEGMTSKPQHSVTLYFDTDDASLDKSDFKVVAAACEFAATLPNARFVISGHADTVGPAAYNDDLSNRRARAVAKAIRNDPRYREALSVVEFGERKLAIATADETAEPMNRRVEITVFEQ